MRITATPLLVCLLAFAVHAAEKPAAEENSIGMKMVPIPAGSFERGAKFDGSWQEYHTQILKAGHGDLPMDQWNGGEVDESPVHRVTISRPFHISATEVTNAQYEQFDPDHGRSHLNRSDDSAVNYVSWNDAVAFCKWLSEKEGKTYRLPTEAEWEYACRAGTTTNFHTGDTLPEGHITPRGLNVALGTPNAWGLYDMHGNVQEWCHDFYGDYPDDNVTDPVGRATSLSRVVRGGSDQNPPAMMRSGNRASIVADLRDIRLGFRVVRAELPDTQPLPEEMPLWKQNVRQQKHDWKDGPPMDKPYFGKILSHATPPPMERRPELPFYATNHCPATLWCPNGDILTIWWSAARDGCRTSSILGARLRAGADEYDPPARFFVAADCELCSSSMFHDGKGKLIWLNNISPIGHWANAKIMASFSNDNGRTWSQPKMVVRTYDQGQPAHMIMFRGPDGALYQPADYWNTHPKLTGNCGGTALWRSEDEGESWTQVTNIRHQLENLGKPGKTAGVIAGPHAVATFLKDGSLLGIGRRATIDGNLIFSRSSDGGQTWTYSKSPFPKIRFGQRPTMLRLKEGPILWVAFTAEHRATGWSKIAPDPRKLSEDDRVPITTNTGGWTFTNADGEEYTGYGMYAAISYDEGKTWPVRKLMTPGGPKRRMFGGGHHHFFIMDDTHAETSGYTFSTQTPDGVIHVINSCLHYRMNLKWIETPPEVDVDEG